MNFGNMGFMEILLILVVVLLLFGAKRLPEIGASMGKGIREFKKSISDVDRSLREPERDDRLDRGYGDRIASPARGAGAGAGAGRKPGAEKTPKLKLGLAIGYWNW